MTWERSLTVPCEGEKRWSSWTACDWCAIELAYVEPSRGRRGPASLPDESRAFGELRCDDDDWAALAEYTTRPPYSQVSAAPRRTQLLQTGCVSSHCRSEYNQCREFRQCEAPAEKLTLILRFLQREQPVLDLGMGVGCHGLGYGLSTGKNEIGWRYLLVWSRARGST